MNKEKLFRYILMKREREMGVSLEEDQLKFFNEMETIINSDPVVKNQIDMLLNTNSMQQMNNILKQGYVEQPNNIVEFKEELNIEPINPVLMGIYSGKELFNIYPNNFSFP